MNKPEAIFDVLYLGARIEAKLDDFSLFEVQFFAYLACLLSLYNGNPISFWTYSFVKTSYGSPFSRSLQDGWDYLLDSGILEPTSEGYCKLTEKGFVRLKLLESLHLNKSRMQFLKASASSISLLPIGYIKQAILKEPVLKTANKSSGNRFLLDDGSPAMKALYKQFKNLRIALSDKPSDNLIIPAVVWIESLLQTSLISESS